MSVGYSFPTGEPLPPIMLVPAGAYGEQPVQNPTQRFVEMCVGYEKEQQEQGSLKRRVCDWIAINVFRQVIIRQTLDEMLRQCLGAARQAQNYQVRVANEALRDVDQFKGLTLKLIQEWSVEKKAYKTVRPVYEAACSRVEDATTKLDALDCEDDSVDGLVVERHMALGDRVRLKTELNNHAQRFLLHDSALPFYEVMGRMFDAVLEYSRALTVETEQAIRVVDDLSRVSKKVDQLGRSAGGLVTALGKFRQAYQRVQERQNVFYNACAASHGQRSKEQSVVESWSAKYQSASADENIREVDSRLQENVQQRLRRKGVSRGSHG